jgi:phage-related tail protein
MNAKEAKAMEETLKDLKERYIDFGKSMKDTANAIGSTKKLWRKGNKSRLIKLGLTLVCFPEPTPVSESIGACFIAAGLVQKGIKSRAIYIEDIKKTFQSALRDILDTQNSMRV